ncbi:MAG: FAD:protein FMN transferase [Anaerobutyricum soehngenii]
MLLYKIQEARMEKQWASCPSLVQPTFPHQETTKSTSCKTEKDTTTSLIRQPDIRQTADLISVTVVSDNGLLSDGLSTACFVLGKEKGQKLLETYGAEGIFIDQNKKVTVTKGLKDKFTILNEEYSE